MGSKPAVAFAGLGAMGFGMAVHLVKSRFQVTGYDVSQAAMDRFAAVGGRVASTPREAARGSEFFICMVANDAQASSVLFDNEGGDEKGAVFLMPKGGSIIMCSTVPPSYFEKLDKQLSSSGRDDIRLIDCPVSGGAGRAAGGTLSIFASGKEEHLQHAADVLECISGRLYRVPGGLGFGSKTKLIHQIFAGVNIAIASEAMGLAVRAGLDPSKTFDRIKDGEASSWMFENRVPHMLDPSLPPYSAMTIIAKDVGIITNAARSLNFPLPMLSSAEQLYLKAISDGLGGEDDCALIKLYLPGSDGLVGLKSPATMKSTSDDSVSTHDMGDLMIGVHLAATSEAMSFCEHLGIPPDLMYDIVSHAAGASNVFLKEFSRMKAQDWSLTAISDPVGVITSLVSLSLSD